MKKLTTISLIALTLTLALTLLSTHIHPQNSILLIPPPSLPSHPHQGKFSRTLIYLYNSSALNYYEDWASTLSQEGYVTVGVNYSDFNPHMECDAIIIDANLKVDAELASNIESAGKPVLAIGLGGSLYLNNTGVTVKTYSYHAANEVHFIYRSQEAQSHEVLNVPSRVNFSGNGYIPLPLEEEELTYVKAGLKRILYDLYVGGYAFMSLNGSTIHLALPNVTKLKVSGLGKQAYHSIINAVDWLSRGAPKLRLIVSSSKTVYEAAEPINVTVKPYDNYMVEWLQTPGETTLTLTHVEKGETAYSEIRSGCNLTFTIHKPLERGNYTVKVTRESYTSTVSIQVNYTMIKIVNLTCSEDVLQAKVEVEGEPEVGIEVVFSYKAGVWPPADFWDNHYEYAEVGRAETNSSGWATLSWNPEPGTYTVVAWIQAQHGPENWTTTLIRVSGVAPGTPSKPPSFNPPTPSSGNTHSLFLLSALTVTSNVGEAGYVRIEGCIAAALGAGTLVAARKRSL
nr:hypothetical protein [Candidatus Freyrarchaeum guaymaensis]